MLKKRVAASLVVNNGIVVQSINFKKYLPVGKPDIAIEFLNQWGIDEIIFLDISASKKNSEPDYQAIKKASKKCFVPLTVGGGITHLDHIKKLMQCGADKVSFNQALLNQPSLISDAAHVFGNQCIVASIDSVKTTNGYKVYDYLNKVALDMDPVTLALRAIELGAGEILINSVDRDGSYLGYDIDLINSICNEISVPLICCGGAANAADFIEVFSKTNASAASAANFYHFSEHSVNITKANLISHVPVRSEVYADYCENNFDANFRLDKKKDSVLEEMLFVRIEQEKI